MWNVLGVLCGTVILAWALFIRRPSARKILSASRWMLLSWGVLFLVHCLSPITFYVLSVSWRAWAFSAVWVGTFVLADNIHFTFYTRPKPVPVAQQAVECSVRSMRVCAAFAVAGALLLAYTHRTAYTSDNSISLITQLRNAQVSGQDSGLLNTIASALACGGLPVTLIEVCRAVVKRSTIPLRGGFSLIAYLAVTIITGGRPGFILGTLSIIVALSASIYCSGLKFARFRKILVAGCLITVTSICGMIYVTSSRTSGFTGDTDRKIELLNRLLATDIDPGFRDSLRPFGVFGDSVIEMFYCLGTQFASIDSTLRYYQGPYGFGLVDLPFLTRRLESISGIVLAEPLNDANNRMFEKIGVWPHFFTSAAALTVEDFGVVLSIPFVFLCGVLSWQARFRALQSQTPFSIALQALICSGAAWTIIMSPSDEQTWAFPLMWFILIYVVHRITAFFQEPLRSVRKI